MKVDLKESVDKLNLRKNGIEALKRFKMFTLEDVVYATNDTFRNFFRTSPRVMFYEIRYSLMELGILFPKDEEKFKNNGIMLEHVLLKVIDLPVDIQIRHTLNKNYIYFLGDLLLTDYKSLKKMRGLGRIGLNELKNYVHGLGYRFPGEYLETREKVEALRSQGIPLLGDILDIDCNFREVLYRNNIFTMDDLLACGFGLYELDGVGVKGRAKLDKALRQAGIELKSADEYEKDVIAEKSANKEVLERVSRKEQLVSEYNSLIIERKTLLAREAQIDIKIREILQAMQNTADMSRTRDN